jgi:hypothetical protein
MLTFGVCGKPMIAMRRGRNMVLTYICREHRGRGTCANGTGVPAIELHHAVIASLRQTFTFTEHLAKQAADTGAREQGAAERANLLAEIPRLAAVEAWPVRRIAMVEDDGQDLTARELPLPAGGLPALSGGTDTQEHKGQELPARRDRHGLPHPQPLVTPRAEPGRASTRRVTGGPSMTHAENDSTRAQRAEALIAR